MFPRPRVEVLPDIEQPISILYEIHAMYGKDDFEVHLVSAENEVNALIKLNRHWKPDRPIQGFRLTKCERYKTVILGARRIV